MEDRYGLTICETGREFCLKINLKKRKDTEELFRMFTAWKKQQAKLTVKEIDTDAYDAWHYNYLKYDSTGAFVKTPFEKLNAAMLDAFKDRLKNIFKDDKKPFTAAFHSEELLIV